jgi:PAS domain S-box-containing protein
MNGDAFHSASLRLEAEPRAGPSVALRTGLPVLLLVAALAACGGAVYVISVSRIAPSPLGQSLLSVLVCLSFVGTGVAALRLPPYARFGLLLSAVGFSSLVTVLHEANHTVPYTVGVFASNLVFAVLVHALLAFPSGRLGATSRRTLAAVAYVDVLVLQAVAVLFDPLTRYHSDHPPNAALVLSRPSLATALLEVEASVAIGLSIAVLFVLTRRARAATPAARRQLVPVLVGGKLALLAFAVGLALAPLSSQAGFVGIGVGLLAAVALPASFLGVMLQGRLSRAAVGELLVELREPGRPPLLRDGLRRALGDPSLELARVRPEDGSYVDGLGAPLSLPGPGDVQVASPILHQGEPVGAHVHDRSLRLRPELLDAVNAAAGFALANERALERVRRVEARDRALLDAIPDLMFRVSRDGTYLDVHADDTSGLLRPPELLLGRNVREVLPPDVADEVLGCVERALETGSMSSVEYRLELDGQERCFESRMVPGAAGEVVTIVRDFTEQRRAEAAKRRLAEEQAALRRVATLVAGDAPPDEVFQAVTGEACALLGIESALLLRYERDDTATVVGKYGRPNEEFTLGSVLELAEGAALTVLRTGAPARVEYEQLPGWLAARMYEIGFRSSVGVPISVAGSTWGALIAALPEGESLPAETDRRLQAFAELAGIAVASAHARDELSASRLRIIEASDAERRRIERNLHDGAQQRLVALSVGLRLARKRLLDAPDEARELLDGASAELAEALTELRELAQGIHPAVLTERGLGAALDVLAARAPLPVALDVRLPAALPDQVAAAGYNLASEALANVVKHARAGSAVIRASGLDRRVVLEVQDDGAGGADPEGSGLCGLRDRVETLDGSLIVESAPGVGTRVRAELPLPAGEAR